jgi:hypothetical protein
MIEFHRIFIHFSLPFTFTKSNDKSLTIFLVFQTSRYSKTHLKGKNLALFQFLEVRHASIETVLHKRASSC